MNCITCDFLLMFLVAVEDSEVNSDRTLDDDNEDDESAATASSAHVSQRSKRDSTSCRDRRSSAPGTERLQQQSTADDTGDSEMKDDHWTYPDDNSPQPRERRDSGVGSSLTRSSRYISLSGQLGKGLVLVVSMHVVCLFLESCHTHSSPLPTTSLYRSTSSTRSSSYCDLNTFTTLTNIKVAINLK